MPINPIQSLVARLTPNQRMGLSFVRAGVVRGFAGNFIQKELTALGLGMSRQRVQTFVRYYRGREVQAGRYRFAKLNTMPDIDNMMVADFRQKKKFNYTVRYTFFDPKDGTESQGFVTVVTNRPLQFGTAVDKAVDAVEKNRKNYPVEILSTSVWDITKREDVRK